MAAHLRSSVSLVIDLVRLPSGSARTLAVLRKIVKEQDPFSRQAEHRGGMRIDGWFGLREQQHVRASR